MFLVTLEARGFDTVLVNSITKGAVLGEVDDSVFEKLFDAMALGASLKVTITSSDLSETSLNLSKTLKFTGFTDVVSTDGMVRSL